VAAFEIAACAREEGCETRGISDEGMARASPPPSARTRFRLRSTAARDGETFFISLSGKPVMDLDGTQGLQRNGARVSREVTAAQCAERRLIGHGCGRQAPLLWWTRASI
jgi:hypothetical protein